MSYSYTQSETKSFTETHAKHIASKVATDLKRMQRFYGEPGDTLIGNFETELIEFLKKGFLKAVSYGYKRNGEWIEPTLCYTAKDLAGMSSVDDDPGKVLANANIVGASFYSYMTYSSAWDIATAAEREAFQKNLPFVRPGATEPGVNGYMSSDKSYSSGGKALDRSTLKKY